MGEEGLEIAPAGGHRLALGDHRLLVVAQEEVLLVTPGLEQIDIDRAHFFVGVSRLVGGTLANRLKIGAQGLNHSDHQQRRQPDRPDSGYLGAQFEPSQHALPSPAPTGRFRNSDKRTPIDDCHWYCRFLTVLHCGIESQRGIAGLHT